MVQLGNNSPPSFLADLPEELSLAIIEELDMASVFALSKTCRQFQRLANPADESRRDKLQDFLLEVQSFPRWSDGFACFSCAKVLPRESFARSQTRLKRGRNTSPYLQMLRFCITCGVSKNLFAPGSQVVQGDVVRFVCRSCKQLRNGRFCERCTICSHCDRRGAIKKQCEEAGRYGGHGVIDKTISSAGPALVTSAFVSLRLGGNRNDSDDFGYSGYSEYDDGYYDSDGKRVVQEWSPEWYDGPDDI